ncbi:hypothetical protein Tco_1143346 [Tanacetum coccineum]
MATARIDADLYGTPTDQNRYRSMIGGLMYLIVSRPDIAFATFVCARYQAHPTEKHLKEGVTIIAKAHMEKSTLGWLLEEIHITWAHLEKKRTRLRLYAKSFKEIVHIEPGDGVMNPKRQRQDFQDDSIRDLTTASERSQLKVALEDSTW